MPKNSSVIKKHLVSLRNYARNKSYKTTIKKATKKIVESLLNTTSREERDKLVSRAYKSIDKAVSKKIIKKNQGSRKKQRIMKYINKYSSSI